MEFIHPLHSASLLLPPRIQIIHKPQKIQENVFFSSVLMLVCAAAGMTSLLLPSCAAMPLENAFFLIATLDALITDVANSMPECVLGFGKCALFSRTQRRNLLRRCFCGASFAAMVYVEWGFEDPYTFGCQQLCRRMFRSCVGGREGDGWEGACARVDEWVCWVCSLFHCCYGVCLQWDELDRVGFELIVLRLRLPWSACAVAKWHRVFLRECQSVDDV